MKLLPPLPLGTKSCRCHHPNPFSPVPASSGHHEGETVWLGLNHVPMAPPSGGWGSSTGTFQLCEHVGFVSCQDSLAGNPQA